MTTERPLTPVGIAALGLLVERSMHPYEMYQLLLAREEDRVLKVRPGTLYHTVDRLEQAGMVRAIGTDRCGNRPERTSFEITEAGRRALTRQIADMLATPAREYPEFTLAVSEAHNLPKEAVLACLRARARALAEEDEHVDALAAAHSIESVPRLYWLNVDFDRAARRAERDWLAGIIDELESGALPWRDEPDVTQWLAPTHHPGVDSAACAPGTAPTARIASTPREDHRQ